MTKPPVLTNRKPADELAWLRERIKELQANEDYIKRMIREGKMSPHGDEFRAEVQTKTQSRFDKKAAEEELGDLSRFKYDVDVTMVRLVPVTDDEVIEADGW